MGAAPGVGDVGDLGLLLQDQLRVAGDARTELRGQAQGLVKRVGVQRLSARGGKEEGSDPKESEGKLRRN